MQTYPALVLAGYSNDKPDILAAAMGVERKALIDIAGKPMVGWIIQALQQSSRVGRVVVVGMGPEDGVDFGDGVTFVPNAGSHLGNVYAGIDALKRLEPDLECLLLVSSDIPLLQPRTIDWLVEVCEGREIDLVYPIVSQEVMEQAFPGVGRSYVRLAEGRFCGGDLFWVRAAVAYNSEPLVRELMARRKSFFQQVRLAGFGNVIKLVLGRLRIPDLERVASRLLQCRAQAIPSPYADIGMDVDKPHQLEMAIARRKAP